jgi:hypothetical protein
MAAQDTTALKEKIISIIRNRGPSFPAQISSQVGMSILFTSAFLSELLSEKKLKISNMKVGSSPLYFIPGQENLLERFSGSLKSKEKDAFELLKEKKFLLDNQQDPAIRVALRSIKDFAFPFQKNDKLYWRYLTVEENELEIEKPKPVEKKPEPKKVEIFDKPNDGEKKEESKKEDKPKVERKKPVNKKVTKKKSLSNGKNEKFFNKVKEYLLGKGVEITDIISFSKDDLVLKVKEGEEREFIVFGYNKKRINEEDILKAYKKVSDFDLGYRILCLGDPAKKTSNLIDSIKNLDKIENIE